MADLSPLNRRILAITILLLMILGAVELVLIPLATASSDALDRLSEARFRRERLQAIADRPSPANVSSPPAVLYVIAPDATRAGGTLGDGLREDAASAGVALQIQPSPAKPTEPQALAADVIASGPEAAIVGFLNRVEQGTPVIRLTRWHLSSDPAGEGLRLEARAEAAWGKPE